MCGSKENSSYSYCLKMFVGTFSPADFYGFQDDVKSAMDKFQEAGVTKLLIDLTNNGGA